MRKNLIDILERHVTLDRLEQKHKKDTLEFIKSEHFYTSRENNNGHITASAWVLSPDMRSVLLTHHKKLDRWLQLGGHIDEDSSIYKAAMREAQEESGMKDLQFFDDKLFDIDVHKIPARKNISEHYHYDFRFIFIANSLYFSISEESHGLAWIDISKIITEFTDESIVRMAIKTKKLLD